MMVASSGLWGCRCSGNAQPSRGTRLKLQAMQGSSELLGERLSDHVGVDRPQVTCDGSQKLGVREHTGCTIIRLCQLSTPLCRSRTKGLTRDKLRRQENGSGTLAKEVR